MVKISFVGGRLTINGASPLDTSYLVGIMFDFAGDAAMLKISKADRALPCEGQVLDIASYPKLFEAIGHTWDDTTKPPTGFDPLTQFRLPPQEVGGLGLYARGVGATNGAVGTYQPDVFKEHEHKVLHTTTTHQSGASGNPVLMDNNSANSRLTSKAGDPVETRPQSITVLKAIWTGE